MKFLDNDFLLETATARRLFHDYAANMPIYDYHCHIIPGEILENRSYENITQIWLNGDHYKWRLMRAAGFDESLISGGAPEYDRFLAFAKTLEQAVGSPVYIWSHLELKRFFGVDEPLTAESAPRIWEQTGEILRSGNMNCRDLVRKFGVKVVCTTDDPCDDLDVHAKLAAEDLGFRVVPAFRPDKYVEIAKPAFNDAIDRLEGCAGGKLESFADLCRALLERVDYFHDRGCRLSDEGIDFMPCGEATADELNAIFLKVRAGGEPTDAEAGKYRFAILTELFAAYAQKGWAAQLHIAALRNTNSRGFAAMGPDTGYDSIDDPRMAPALAAFLDGLESKGNLPKTILYSANGNHNDLLATMAANFQGGSPGKMQFGAAWWFNDHFDGMTAQLTALASNGLLGRFVGMLTDSRSFLSYTRHEYFRRVLCNFIGRVVERGEYPEDWDNLGRLVQNICYNNAENYFGI